MKRRAWKTKIKEACKTAGTYKPIFESVIDTLARILEKRDDLEEEIDRDDEEWLVEVTSKSGITNLQLNPLFKTWKEVNEQALTYWKELGLTPASLKKINDEAFKEAKKTNNLMEMLKESRKGK